MQNKQDYNSVWSLIRDFFKHCLSSLKQSQSFFKWIFGNEDESTVNELVDHTGDLI